MKTVSVVMVYYNRPQQLLITLKTLEYICKDTKDFEIIIVDDGSDSAMSAHHVAAGIVLPLKIISINPKDKTWINPSVPFNKGIFATTGDIICIQPAECFHFGGNLIECARRMVGDNDYLSFSCYNTIEGQHLALGRIVESNGVEFMSGIHNLLYPMNNTVVPIPTNPFINAWFNHPQYLPTKYHYFSCMTMNNMRRLCGFNTQFADGYGYDDDEFLFRIEDCGMKVSIVNHDVGFVVHQWHPRAFPDLKPGGPEWLKNKERYARIVGCKRKVHG